MSEKNGWKALFVSDLIKANHAETKTGPFGTQLKASSYVESGTPVINVRNIGFGNIRPDKLEFIGPDTVKRLSTHLLLEDDIVFGRKGAVERHAFIRPEQRHWFQGSDCLRLRFNANDLVLPRFVSYFLLTEEHKSWMMNQCSHGATMASLNQDIISRIPLLLPSLPTQRKIASILSAYDDLIENNSRRIAILEEMAQAIYREWFVNFRFPGHENVKLVEGDQVLPYEWHRKSLIEIADLRLGKMLDAKKNKGDLMPYLANVNVRWGMFDLQNMREMKFEADELETYGLRYGDIVMCEGGEPGRCAIWTDQVPNMMLQKAIHRIRAKDEVNFRYLYYKLLDKARSGHLESLFTGSTIKHLPGEKLKTVFVEVPTKKLMDLFSKMVEPMACQVEVLTKKSAILRKTRDLLLPKLISGQLDVEDLDIETSEPLVEAEA